MQDHFRVFLMLKKHKIDRKSSLVFTFTHLVNMQIRLSDTIIMISISTSLKKHDIDTKFAFVADVV